MVYIDFNVGFDKVNLDRLLKKSKSPRVSQESDRLDLKLAA